ncbi:MAG TPA: DUF4430 domain-containing protein [Gaiellaceae bacterium]|nr:DUF4430 domain-containing protein [Gaiellaceae bacterium]
MLRRTLAAVAALAALAALAPVAGLAARVGIRVEGRTQTLFAPAPRLVEAATPLEALERASLAGEFYYHVADASFGRYVDQIGRYGASGSSGWVFKVNGASPPVGADAVQLKDGDSVLWYHAEFGPAGGPPTLRLARTSRRARGAACYEVTAFDDAGKQTPAAFATVAVDGRRTRATRLGLACPGRHRGLVRATLAGTVRSNALR